MTLSKEYRDADPFKRYLIRQIKAGKKLIKNGWYEHQKGKTETVYLPLDPDTLILVKDEYDRFQHKVGAP